MKPIIKNPVLNNNPWRPLMPNNYRSCNAAKKPVLRPVLKIIRREVKLVKQPRPAPRRPSKRDITKNYTEQIKHLYPNLKKTQVMAAVILANNNLRSSRLLLDLTNKLLNVPPVKTNLFSKISHGDGSFSNDTFNTAKFSSVSAPKALGKENFNNDSGLGMDFHADASSDVYEYNESDSNIPSFSSYKQGVVENKKVGVSIIKFETGYKSFLL